MDTYIPYILLQNFPLDRYKIIPQWNDEYGMIYFVQSHSGIAVDDFGRWYDANGRFIQSAGTWKT